MYILAKIYLLTVIFNSTKKFLSSMKSNYYRYRQYLLTTLLKQTILDSLAIHEFFISVGCSHLSLPNIFKVV